MSDTYNLYNLEAPFKQFLLSGIAQSRTEPESTGSGTGTKKQMTPVSVKNYLSDIRHFFGWLVSSDLHRSKADSHGSTDQRKSASKSAKIDFGQLETLLTLTVINDYKNYLITNNLPHKTINRRLSTVRKFCSFCISQGWMKENPGKKISNIKYQISNIEILKEFKEHLLKENLDSKTVNSYLEDVREFLGLL